MSKTQNAVGKNYKLSTRALEILLAVRDACDSGNRFYKIYWKWGYRVAELNRDVLIGVGGALDAGEQAIFKSFERKGFVEIPPGGSDAMRWYYSITEEGCLAIESNREAGHWPEIEPQYTPATEEEAQS